MPVERFRSLVEIAPPWRPGDDPANLAKVAQSQVAWVLALCHKLAPPQAPEGRRLRSLAEANADHGDFYRSERLDLLVLAGWL